MVNQTPRANTQSYDLKETKMEIIDQMKEFYRIDEIDKTYIPETLPGSLKKEFEDYTVTALQIDKFSGSNLNEFETPLLWDDLCCIYEALRELILDGKLKGE
jgi:hypothetical protein